MEDYDVRVAPIDDEIPKALRVRTLIEFMDAINEVDPALFATLFPPVKLTGASLGEAM